MIRIEKVNKFYNKNRQNELHVLNDISLELPDNGMVAIFGRSGCGKTTLLNSIGGLDSINSGYIYVDGDNIAKNTDVLRNKYIGYIFQNYNLNPLESNFDNVADALRLCGITDREIIKTRTFAALANVGMENYKYRTPDTLSGGQMQRIAIARAIVKNPRIILADEPTGNLDEANTVMIMDLLKQISRNHLVILVTHEANLVDHYCDRVIELSDGIIKNQRENENANGYNAKSKNDIYLGELDKTSLSAENLMVDYYGTATEQPIKLRLINQNGKLYISIDTPGVQVLDSTSEIKLKEGVYESHPTQNELSDNIDMSALPPIQGSHFGKLFSFFGSVKSGLEANFMKKKRGRGLLRLCMIMFSFIIVFMTAYQGTAIRTYLQVKSAYNPNTFYVYSPNYDIGDRLLSAYGTNGIDYMRILPYNPIGGDETLTFSIGMFETYSTGYYSSGLSTKAVFLPYSLCSDLKVVAGTVNDMKDNEIILSTASADKIIDSSTYSFINNYSDIIGMVCKNNIVGASMVVKGVVESDENAAYISDKYIKDMVFQSISAKVYTASNRGYTVPDGNVILVVNSDTYIDTTLPKTGNTVKLFGRDYTVSETITYSAENIDYTTYLINNGYQDKASRYMNYFSECKKKAAELHPEYDGNNILELAKEIYDSTYFSAAEEYYSELNDYIRMMYVFGYGYGKSLESWAYMEKGVEIAKYYIVGDETQAIAYQYYLDHGEYPNINQLPELGQYQNLYNDKVLCYQSEFELSYKDQIYDQMDYIYDFGFLMSDSDYFNSTYALGSSLDGVVQGDYISSEETFPFPYYYTLIHSNDPKATTEFLEANFSDTELAYDYLSPLITPDRIYNDLLMDQRITILSSLITILAFIGVLSFCMYIIMRSSMMGRIKEIGIYRAIGVSKRNLLFRFFIESVVLTTLTVFIGYLLSSFVISSLLGTSSLISMIFYYPLWLALAVLILLYAVCTFCGCLPVMTLLSKTPSEILSKYDI